MYGARDLLALDWRPFRNTQGRIDAKKEPAKSTDGSCCSLYISACLGISNLNNNKHPN
jgi:hypothetical protein